jgi:hypothetical protein
MFYKKGIDISNTKEMYNFLKTHYTYDTMNSWNNLKSIANNVKIYNLNLDGDCWNALAYLQDDDYFTINSMIEDWEAEHEGYSVGFNGRSGGYLVLYSKHHNRSVLPDYINDTEDYEEFKDYVKDYWGGVKYLKQDLRDYTKLVQDFDKLCDEIRDYVNSLSLRSFTDDKIEVLLDDFAYEYEAEMLSLGIDCPDVELSTDKEISVKIDSKMRTLKSLMDCFFHCLRTDYWTIIDDGSTIIKLTLR